MEYKPGDKFRLKPGIGEEQLRNMGYSSTKIMNSIIKNNLFIVDKCDYSDWDNMYRIYYTNPEFKTLHWIWESLIELAEKRPGHCLTKMFQFNQPN